MPDFVPIVPESRAASRNAAIEIADGGAAPPSSPVIRGAPRRQVRYDRRHSSATSNRRRKPIIKNVRDTAQQPWLSIRFVSEDDALAVVVISGERQSCGWAT